MNPVTFSHRTGRKGLSRDQIGILLLLIMGIAGQLSVFLVPDPLKILAPRIPLLTPEDWPGSYVGTEMSFTDNYRVSYDATFPFTPARWEERRGFYQSLYLTGDNFLSSVEQIVVWYASPDESAQVWKREFDRGVYNSWPFIESHHSPDQPASFLACAPNPGPMTSPPQCWYLAYWEHWFMATFFYRQSNGEIITEDRLMKDIRQLTARADQLLMSAPREPCFGFLCTVSN